MLKHMLPMLVAWSLVSFVGQAHAVAIVQDSCQTFQSGGNPALRIFFSVVNSNSPAVYRVTFQPAGAPPDARCSVQGQQAAFGWGGTLLAGGVTFATSSDPVFAGTVMREFALEVGVAPYCCYDVRFLDASGQLIDDRTQCLLCSPTDAGDPPVPPAWSFVKALYR